MKKPYKYDAFISYRHADLDRFVAENLQKQLEWFKIPGSLKKDKKLSVSENRELKNLMDLKRFYEEE